MEKLDLISISAALFLVSFLYHFYISKPSISVDLTDLIPFVIIVGTSKLDVLYTDYSIFKIALIACLIYKTVLYLIDNRVQHNTVLFFNLVISIGIIVLLLSKIILPLVVINAGLIIMSTVIIIIKLKVLNSVNNKQNKEVVEVGFLGYIGAVALSLGNTHFNIFMGLAIIVLYQISELALAFKYFQSASYNTNTRLNSLEQKFERTVEFEAKKRTAQMTDKVEHIREKSQKDPLSKALNRHGIVTEINAAITDSNIKIFSIAILDIDFFKAINDSKGHIVGDECLKFLSYTFMSHNRKTDFFGRYGGDEFILLMPHVNAPAALEICERIKNEIAIKSSPKFSISMGIASYPYDGRTFTELVELADKGLYHSKEQGRNRVSYAGVVPILKK